MIENNGQVHYKATTSRCGTPVVIFLPDLSCLTEPDLRALNRFIDTAVVDAMEQNETGFSQEGEISWLEN